MKAIFTGSPLPVYQYGGLMGNYWVLPGMERLNTSTSPIRIELGRAHLVCSSIENRWLEVFRTYFGSPTGEFVWSLLCLLPSL